MPKLLIADDEPHIRLLLTQTLEALEDDGVELSVEPDGQAALARIRSERPDVVFLDVMMPRMNGFQLTAAIRNSVALAQLPVILVTARGTDEDKARGVEVGANAYIVKSGFDQKNLLETLTLML